jgi:hypothetical protein
MNMGQGEAVVVEAEAVRLAQQGLRVLMGIQSYTEAAHHLPERVLMATFI